MLAGELYNASVPEIQADQLAAAAWMGTVVYGATVE